MAEGESVEVTVTLSADPERDVTVEHQRERSGRRHRAGQPRRRLLRRAGQRDVQCGETEQSFTITAVNDTVDDDGESVALGFGNLPPGVLRGDGTTVTIDDDDVPDVVVSFGAAAYDVDEGASVRVIVELNKDPERQVVIPITASNRGTTSDQDYSGVPIITGVTFESGDTEKEISFSATQDTLTTTANPWSSNSVPRCPRRSVGEPCAAPRSRLSMTTPRTSPSTSRDLVRRRRGQ